MVLMSLINPVSPDRYAFKPLVNVTTNPLASPAYALMPFAARFVRSGSLNNVGDSSSGCAAGTAAICTPLLAETSLTVRFAPNPIPAVHGVVRGTVISLLRPADGHPGVFVVPAWAAILVPRKLTSGPPPRTAEFFAAAISAIMVFGEATVGAPTQRAFGALGS